MSRGHHSQTDRVLAAAAHYAKKGRNVFPIATGTKAPHGKLAPHGFNDATTDAGTVETWRPFGITAIATVPAPECVVLDIDVRNDGFEVLHDLEVRLGRLPDTATAHTPSGGEHRWYKLPAGVVIQSRSAAFGWPGVDVKSAGGYVLLPPSLHPDGGEYRWDQGMRERAPLPSRWIAALQGPPRSGAAFALNAETIAKGSRHDTLMRAASSLRDKGFSPDEMLGALLAMNRNRCRPPLPEDEVRNLAADIARRYSPQHPIIGPARRAPDHTRLVVRPLSGIERVQVTWLWQDRFAESEPCVLAGCPGVGKGYVAAAVATALTLGNAPPGGGLACAPSDVIVLSLEDDPARVLRARYEDLGADLSRVHIIDGVQRGEERVQAFTLGHIDLLDAAIVAHPQTRLLIIDPVMSVMGGTDTWRSNEVRARLDPFIDACTERGVGVLMCMHTNKSAAQTGVFRVEGALGGFVGRARTVLGVGIDPQTGIRGVGLLKTNLGKMDVPVVAFEIDDAGKFFWKGETTETTAHALFESAKSDDDKGKGEDCRDGILAALSDGDKTAAELQHVLRAQGHAERTIERERVRLKRQGLIERTGGGKFGGPLRWCLTAHKPPTSPYSANEANGGLCDSWRSMADGANQESNSLTSAEEAIEW